MKCSVCGKDLKDGAKFCTSCGTVSAQEFGTQPSAAHAAKPPDPWAPSNNMDYRAAQQHQPPPQHYEDKSKSAHASGRGGCLTAWLILMIIGNLAVGLFYVKVGHMHHMGEGQMMDAMYAKLSTLPLRALALLAFVQVLCAFALFFWKKIGFFVFVGCNIICILLVARAGVAVPRTVGSAVIGIGILFYLLRNAWNEMKLI